VPAVPKLDGPRRALLVGCVTTLVVTALSHLDELVPKAAPYVGTLVGATFLAVTWRTVLRKDSALVRAHGLSLGGLTEEGALEARRIVREAAVALGWAALVAAIIFPIFWLGYRYYWQVRSGFALRVPADWWDIVLGQLLVVALPEEAFYRGYLQTALVRPNGSASSSGGKRGFWTAHWRILGADLGPGWLVTCAIFAAGHYLALPHPSRLAVFFPALVFGWLRARTGGIGAAMAFHTMCNLLTETLARGYHGP